MAQITLNSSGVASSGTLALQSNGTTTAVTIDTSQRVGIGNSATSPTSLLYLRDTGNIQFVISKAGVGAFDIFNKGSSGTEVGTTDPYPLILKTNDVERARIDSSGNFGIGVSAPAAKLEVNGLIFVNDTANTSGRFLIRNSTTGANAGGYDVRQIGVDTSISNVSNGYMSFSTNNTEAARIDSSGNLLIGSTAFQITTTRFQAQATGLSYAGVFVNDNGGYQTLTCYNKATSGTIYLAEFGTGTSYGARGSITYNGTVVSYNTTSDYRLKNTIAPMTGALAKVALLNPCTYKWNSNGFDGEGFIAHELAEVFPSAVAGEKDAVDDAGNPKYQGIDVSFLVATLTAAIQELNAKFEAYKASHP